MRAGDIYAVVAGGGDLLQRRGNGHLQTVGVAVRVEGESQGLVLRWSSVQLVRPRDLWKALTAEQAEDAEKLRNPCSWPALSGKRSCSHHVG